MADLEEAGKLRKLTERDDLVCFCDHPITIPPNRII